MPELKYPQEGTNAFKSVLDMEKYLGKVLRNIKLQSFRVQ